MSSAFIGRLFFQIQAEAQTFLKTGNSVSFKAPLSAGISKY